MRSAANVLETVDAKTDHRLAQPIVASAAMTELMRLAKRAATSDAVNALMGSKPEARFRFIQERAAFAKDLDI